MCFFTWLPTFCCMMASSEIQYQERRKHSTNFSWHPRSQIASCIMVNGDCSFQELKVTVPIFPSLNLPLKRQEVYCMSASYILTPFRHFFHNYIIFKKIFGVISHQLQSKWSEWKPPVPNQSLSAKEAFCSFLQCCSLLFPLDILYATSGHIGL